MTLDFIIAEKVESFGKITFNNGSLNILTTPMLEEILQALNKFSLDPTLKGIVFDHNGKVFSAGVDVADHVGDKAEKMLKTFHAIFKVLFRLECPTIASVKGAALGGGAEIALFCDFVLASDKAKFGQPEIKVGVFPPIAAVILPRLAPYKKAFELLLHGETIDANEAHQLGLVNHVFPAETYDEQFNTFLKRFNELSTVIIRHTKKAIMLGLNVDFDSKINQLEEYYLKTVMNTYDANEGLQAFLEKRKPRWQNR